MKKMYGLVMGCVGVAAILSACTPQMTTNVPNVLRVENVDVGDEGKVTVNSSESVEITPDMAEIVYGITSEDEDASACQQKNTETLNQVLAFLKEQGYEDESIKTTGFSLEPRYDWSGNTQKLVGYSMYTQVTVTDVPMEAVGGLLSKTVESGANEIQNVTYFSSTYDQAYKEALEKAVELARGKAQAIAEADGRRGFCGREDFPGGKDFQEKEGKSTLPDGCGCVCLESLGRWGAGFLCGGVLPAL